MPPASSSFRALNTSPENVPEFMGSFNLSAHPNTDLWRKPPTRDTSTAPILYTSLRNPFVSAEVTVSADWELEWDQAGLVIFAGDPPSGMQNADPAPGDGRPPAYTPPRQASKWVKVGLEFCNLTCHASSVCATMEGADYALTTLPPHHAHRSDLRLKIERIGTSLWVWYEDALVGWKKLRDVTWFFYNVEDKAVRVGVYASRPANFPTTQFHSLHGGGGRAHRDLCVQFDDLEIF